MSPQVQCIIYTDNIYGNNYNYSDLRSLTLNVVWRFNNYNKQYKGESAAEDEIRRL